MNRPQPPPPPKVHNHGPDEGPGMGCNETRGQDGRLRGACLSTYAPAGHEPDWTQMAYPSGSVVVDGVAYTNAALREIIRERHTLVMDVALWRGYAERRQIKIEQLETRLARADRHLRLRTAALVRVIARKAHTQDGDKR